MRKIIGVIFAFIGLSIIFAACRKDSFADRLEREAKVINQFVRDQGFKVRNDYPTSRVFADKEYFKDSRTGVYIHVIDSGNDDKIKNGDLVLMKYYNTRLLMSSPDSLNTNDQQNRDEFAEMSMVYGSGLYTANYDGRSLASYYMYMFLSPACARPLDFNLGNNAEVSLLVPFLNGSSYQQYSGYEPVFFGRLRYTLF
jgi:hypothetical protein